MGKEKGEGNEDASLSHSARFGERGGQVDKNKKRLSKSIRSQEAAR